MTSLYGPPGSVGVAVWLELPLFRSKDHRAGPTIVVYVPAQRLAVHADGRWCTWMYETRNETDQAVAFNHS